jgi:hypothetical protein
MSLYSQSLHTSLYNTTQYDETPLYGITPLKESAPTDIDNCPRLVDLIGQDPIYLNTVLTTLTEIEKIADDLENTISSIDDSLFTPFSATMAASQSRFTLSVPNVLSRRIYKELYGNSAVIDITKLQQIYNTFPTLAEYDFYTEEAYLISQQST